MTTPTINFVLTVYWSNITYTSSYAATSREAEHEAAETVRLFPDLVTGWHITPLGKAA